MLVAQENIDYKPLKPLSGKEAVLPSESRFFADSSLDIVLDNLYLSYGRTVVLQQVTDIFPAGRITVILGGSGCGKSTLLRHILGLNKPQSGTIYIGGKDIFASSSVEFKKIRRHIGMLFQDGALLGSLTLAENVALPLLEHTNLSKAIITDIVQYKLSLVGLEDFAAYFPNQLSGGMRKRAGLARALVMEPSILLCDEPTSGLDPINSAQMDALLMALKEEFAGMTIVVVSHDLVSTFMIADHVLMLNEQKVAFTGSKEELLSSKDTYIRKFLDRKPEMDFKELSLTRKTLSEEVRSALQDWFRE